MERKRNKESLSPRSRPSAILDAPKADILIVDDEPLVREMESFEQLQLRGRAVLNSSVSEPILEERP